MSMSLTGPEIVDMFLMHSKTARVVRPSHINRLARSETSSKSQSPRESLELDHEYEAGLITREGKPIPLLLPGGFEVRSAQTPRDFEARWWVTHQVVRGAPPEGDIDDLMSPGKGEGQRRDGDGRELDLPREFEGSSQSDNRLLVVTARVDREDEFLAAEPGMSSARMRNVYGARRSTPSSTDAPARMIVSHRSRGCKIGKSRSRQCTSFIHHSPRRQPAGLIRITIPILALQGYRRVDG